MKFKDLLKPFTAKGVMAGLGAVSKGTNAVLRGIWGGGRQPLGKKIGLFIPRLLASAVVGVASIAATTVVAAGGAITAGIIRGTVQMLAGVAQIIGGAPVQKALYKLENPDQMTDNSSVLPKKDKYNNENPRTAGLLRFSGGFLKLLGGTVIAGSVGLAAATGIGAPAIALIAPATAALSTIPVVGATLAQAGVGLAAGLTAAHAGVVAGVATALSSATAAGAAAGVVLGAGAAVARVNSVAVKDPKADKGPKVETKNVKNSMGVYK
jgi:hypothetical protein